MNLLRITSYLWIVSQVYSLHILYTLHAFLLHILINGTYSSMQKMWKESSIIVSNWSKNILLMMAFRNERMIIRSNLEEELQDGGRVRRGDHLLPHKYIRNTSTCGTTPTEHLLNTGRRPQTSQKARNSPTYLGRAKAKRKNRDKRRGTGPALVGGSCEGGKVSTH